MQGVYAETKYQRHRKVCFQTLILRAILEIADAPAVVATEPRAVGDGHAEAVIALAPLGTLNEPPLEASSESPLEFPLANLVSRHLETRLETLGASRFPKKSRETFALGSFVQDAGRRHRNVAAGGV